MIKKRIENKLTELRLSHIKKCYDRLSRTAEAEEMDYRQYLLELLEVESSHRRENRIQRYLKESKLPLEKSMETYDMKRLPGKLSRQIKILTDGSFIDRRENVLAFGNPGSGKTHLVCALAQELIKEGRRCLFTTCSFLIQKLLASKRELNLEKELKKISKYEVLIIDEVGYTQQTRDEMEVLFTLLAQRYEKASVMITSNLPFSKWEQIFKDPLTTAAAIDRLVHHSIILEFNIPSYRVEKAKQKKERR